MALVKKYALAILVQAFDKINIEGWVTLLKAYHPYLFSSVFSQVSNSKSIPKVYHLFKILQSLITHEVSSFVQSEIDRIPSYLKELNLHKTEKDNQYQTSYKEDELSKKDFIIAIIHHLLDFSKHKANDKQWIERVVNILGSNQERKYINEVLAIVLLDKGVTKGKLYDQIHAMCITDFSHRANNKPQPPIDWSRALPQNLHTYDQDVWDMLQPFLESPTEKVFEYRKAQSYRSRVESALKNVVIDLKTETVKKGSPHTLKITKTQAAYERKYSQWQEDVKLLEQLKAVE